MGSKEENKHAGHIFEVLSLKQNQTNTLCRGAEGYVLPEF